MTEVVWVDGTLVDPLAPAVGALDHGLTVGDGVFETLTVRDGVPFALRRHLARLAYSLSRMGLDPVDETRVRSGIAAVMHERPLDVGRVRITVTSGVGGAGVRRGGNPPRIMVTGSAATPVGGSRVVRAPWVRNERSPLTGVKTTSYAENVLLARFAAEQDADEVLLLNTRGEVCEAAVSNVFVERSGVVLTPALASGCLPGITRGLLLEWGLRAELPIRVASPGELTAAICDEAIQGRAHLALSSTTRGLQSVESLDGHRLSPGPLLTRLAAVFARTATREIDPAPPRATAV